MTVAYAKIVLDYFGNVEISAKRKLLDELKNELRKKNQVSIEEIEDFDDTERCVLGISLVQKDEKTARARLNHVLSVVDSISPARVINVTDGIRNID